MLVWLSVVYVHIYVYVCIYIYIYIWLYLELIFFLKDPIYLQSVIIHSAHGGKGEGCPVEEYSVALLC
jgi:hypothetical protein